MDEQRLEFAGQDGTTVRLILHRPQGDARYSVTEKDEVIAEHGAAAPFTEAERRKLVDHARRARRYPELVEYFAFLLCDRETDKPSLWTRPRRSVDEAAHDIRGRVAIARPFQVLANSEHAAREQFQAQRELPVEE